MLSYLHILSYHIYTHLYTVHLFRIHFNYLYKELYWDVYTELATELDFIDSGLGREDFVWMFIGILSDFDFLLK